MISRDIKKRISTSWWSQNPKLFASISTLFVGSLGTAIIGNASGDMMMQNTGLVMSAVLGPIDTVEGYGKYRRINNEPAELSLNDYIQMPDYTNELGFIHHVEKDLHNVFKAIPQEYKPIVIFIDDLDRCSPKKVADVVEGLNLFLAGEFEDCIFIIGMDPQMVAAALETAHDELIKNLPADDRSTPIGWRFMNKFVQLPFAIPPVEETELNSYAASLVFRGDVEQLQKVDKKMKDPDDQIIEQRKRKRVSVSRDEEVKSDIIQQQYLQPQHLIDEKIKQMDDAIDNFSEMQSQIAWLVMSTSADFAKNPRELKRFYNVLRLFFFLKSSREASNLESPSDEQLRRWIVLSLKWPQVVRWLRYSYGGTEEKELQDLLNPGKKIKTSIRLRDLEVIGEQSNNLDEWISLIEKKFRLRGPKSPWITDEELMKFFKAEGEREENERLSSASGKGFW